MKKQSSFFIGALGLVAVFVFVVAQEKASPQNKNFYEHSLHFTNKGLEYWYSKEQGGLERLTGIPFSETPCAKCHVRTCDACHKQEINGKAKYSLEPVRTQDVCQNCHQIEALEMARKNPEDPAVDVHFKNGMKCMDCHTAREIHGDGTPYNSMQQPGAMDVRCEECHGTLSRCASHTVHGDKVDCNACHLRDLLSCYNCHIDTRMRDGKSVSIPLNNLLFLINHDGQVTLGDLHTFVYQNKTMITFAASFPHWVMKEGRKCEECHDTPIIKDIQKNKFYPVVFENGELKNVSGIVPVLDGMKWNFIYLNYENGRWVPIPNPEGPLINYAGYSQPLTPEQFRRLGNAPSKK
ncbi:MAG: hypothetical protein WCC06_06345 [Candidatus Aminicenantales bacterium]